MTGFHGQPGGRRAGQPVAAVAGLAIILAACTPATEPALEVDASLRLLDVLDAAGWSPDVINLNNPSIAAITADLDGEAVAALLAHPPARVTWTLRLVTPVRLVSAVGLRRGAWERSGDGTGFRVVIEDGRRRVLFERHLDPRRQLGDRGWIPVDVDLSAWKGSTIRLVLATDVGPGTDPTFDWAVWRDPRLLVTAP